MMMCLQGIAGVWRQLNYSGLNWNRIRWIRLQVFW